MSVAEVLSEGSDFKAAAKVGFHDLPVVSNCQT